MIYIPAEDSWLLAKQVKKYAKNKKVLDIGAGSGIQSENALKAGAKDVLAAEIDDESCLLLKKKGINVIKSNLFENIKEKFDLIIFNPPYLPEDKREDTESAKATTGGKKGDEIILRFIDGAGKHLAKEGLILLLVSSLTPKKRILDLIEEKKMKKKIISKKKIFMELLEVWKIW